MVRRHRQALRLGAACLAALWLGLLNPATPRGASSNIVISQVYGGGGNSGATYTNDFIELFNRGNAPVTVTGWTVQYASSTGSTWQTTALTGTIPAGGYYLVQQAQGAGGTDSLPSPNATGTIPMSATAGKVALVSTSTALSGTCPAGTSIVDFFAFGGANCSETSPTAALSNTTAALRKDGGCTDTDNNSADFTISAPAPRNSATPLDPCDGPPPLPTLSIGDASVTEGNSDSQTVTFTVSLNSSAPAGGVTFDITTVDGTATAADGDYIPKGLTGQVIPSGEQTYSFTVTINGDTAIESNESFYVDVSNVAGATVGDGQAIGTITNDDFAPAVFDVVISQVYGAGGNNGATHTHDFIELFNRGSAAVSLAGWSVQYASATGTTWSVTPLSGSIQPGQYFLVQQAGGTNGTPLPAPDATGGVLMAAGAGKVALRSSSTAFTGTCPSGDLVDFAGYGSTASCFEGTGSTAAPSASLSAQRKRGGCFDSNDNRIDFLTAAPNPRNSSSPIRSCEFLSLPIHTVQGSALASPFVGQDVVTTGVVTGVKSNGFFIQVPDEEIDGDPETSEGLFVFTSATPSVSAGDLVTARGTIGEFFNLTQIESTLSGDVTVSASSSPLPAPILLTTTILDPNGSVAQLERFEGMRVEAASLTSVAPTNDFGEIHTVLNGVVRPMREPGIERGSPLPPDPATGLPDCCVPVWDLNPERLVIDTDGLLGATPLSVTSNVTLNGAVGPFDFTFGEYKLLPSAPLTASPNMTVRPVPTRAANEFTVAGYNIENYAGAEAQKKKAALNIRNVMRYPDVIGVVEIASETALQALAVQVNADAISAGDENPEYEGRLIPGTNGTQHVGFLIKKSRVLVNSITQMQSDGTFTNPVNGNTELLHDRPPLVLDAIVDPNGVNPGRIIVVVNHLRSFIDIESVTGEGVRVRAKRTAQAEAIARLLQDLQEDNDGIAVISVGDYNAYEFSDGYTDPLSVLKGQPTPGDRIVVAGSPDVVNPDFMNLTDGLPSNERYSFIFEGTPQALDHVLVNTVAARYLQRYAIARSNADFPNHAALAGDSTRPERSSDHDAPVAYFAFPGTPVVTLLGAATMNVEAFTSFADPGATAHDDMGTLAVTVTGAVDVNQPGTYTLRYTATNGYRTTTVERTVVVADTIAPAIDGFSVSPTTFGPPNHSMFDVAATYTPTDASGVPSCVLNVSSNESTNGIGDGNTGGDWLVVDTRQVQLRAERTGTGTGRVYTITVTCSDPSGNASSKTGTVTIAK